MDLSIVIPTLNRLETLEPCLDSIVRNTHVDYEVIVYANCCKSETRALLSKYTCVRTIEDRSNKFFTEAVNTAISQCRGEYVFLLNDDCELRNDRWFPFYRGLAERGDNIAMIGPVHHNLDSLPYGWIEPFASLYRRDILDRIGPLPYYDESFVLWWSDIYHSYQAMNMGFQLIALAPALVDIYVEHKRSGGGSGDTVLKFRHVLPGKCFKFHGKELMYKRLGIQNESNLAGYYGGRVWSVDNISSVPGVQS